MGTTSVLAAGIDSRAPLSGVEAYSGAWIERVALAGGRVVLVKHLPAEGDWLTRSTDGAGRAQLLWHSGLLSRLGPAVDHGVLGIETMGDHDALIMEDLSERLWEASGPLTGGQVRRGLAGLARLHDLGERILRRGEVAGRDLCAVWARYGMFSPAWHAGDDGPHPHPARERIIAGWDLFFERVGAEVGPAMAAVHDDPAGFGRKVAALGGPPTVFHSDAKPENLGVGPGGRLVAIDWGELTGVGPREVDVAWFALMSTRSRLAADPDEVVGWYEDASGEPLDRAAVDLACVASLAQMGFRLAGAAAGASDRGARVAAAARLSWWEHRVGAALERGVAP